MSDVRRSPVPETAPGITAAVKGAIAEAKAERDRWIPDARIIIGRRFVVDHARCRLVDDRRRRRNHHDSRRRCRHRRRGCRDARRRQRLIGHGHRLAARVAIKRDELRRSLNNTFDGQSLGRSGRGQVSRTGQLRRINRLTYARRRGSIECGRRLDRRCRRRRRHARRWHARSGRSGLHDGRAPGGLRVSDAGAESGDDREGKRRSEQGAHPPCDREQHPNVPSFHVRTFYSAPDSTKPAQTGPSSIGDCASNRAGAGTTSKRNDTRNDTTPGGVMAFRRRVTSRRNSAGKPCCRSHR